MRNYAIYLRKSRSDGDMTVEETLNLHENQLTELALNDNYNVVKIYREVVSGESIESRPKMIELLNDIYADKYDGVLVKDIDRLSRGNIKDQGVITEAFKITNTLIITPNKIYDSNKEADESFLDFNLLLSRFEYKFIKNRLIGGIEGHVKNGEYLGNYTSYGYKKCVIDKRKTIDIIDDEAEVIKMIFELRVDGLSFGKVADELNSKEIKTRKGKEWKRSTICDIIKNPIYKGYVRWNKKKTVKRLVENKIANKRIKNDDYILKKGLHQPIISEEMWQLAQ